MNMVFHTIIDSIPDFRHRSHLMEANPPSWHDLKDGILGSHSLPTFVETIIAMSGGIIVPDLFANLATVNSLSLSSS